MDASALLLLLAAQLVQEVPPPQPPPATYGEEIVVTAARVEQRVGEVPASVTVLGRETIERSPAATLDDLLRQVPGFSLFRRTSSVVAHPTSQGVSLRGIGPSGSSRALVLVDGVPLNDPFGGWVAWSRVPLDSIDRIEVVRGGGANLWGSSALGGAIHVLTASPGEKTLRASAGVGNRGTKSAGLFAGHRTGRLGLSVAASAFDTEGWETVRRDQRGPIDIPATSENRTLSGKLEVAAGEALIALHAGLFSEERGNGTPLTGNSTDADHVAVTASWGASWGDWQASLFSRRQTFSSTFSAQAPDRASELPSLDQFDVGADDLGLGLQGSWQVAERHLLSAGADARRVRGETNEDFRFVENRFTSRRAAGGEHLLAGLWLQEVFSLSSAWQVTAGGRLDFWQSVGGFRRERSLETGAALRDESFPDRDHLALHPRLGLLYRASGDVSLRGALYRSFRAPTLNGQFRPFRVRNDITEADPGLRPERLDGAEIGMDLERGALLAKLTAFWSEIADPIANVTLGSAGEGPATIAPCGFVPAGGICRQRRNLGRARVRGVEAEARLRPRRFWELAASALWTDGRIVEAAEQPELEGRRLAQAPRAQASFQVAYARPERIDLALQARAVGSQFEDDLNTLPLAGFTVVDLSAARELRRGWAVVLNVENLLDTEVEAGRTAEGLVSVGTPRLYRLGLRVRPALP